ncbi:MAG: beta-ketoacyl-ACP synthase II [Candidatus Cloacimonetes bacterium]|nr:beta-ketoacyl-ACP synthase II [Candidatus Cloacimonadota bacterium]MCF7815116.1 beta-ketoacyl-ACP synthase II [Candidatus Cloacimonadota bacterium]MCF7868605.1 beta-ketoacyl-ACP synthase II [Candidatus Cloacimonadota bacterium]MCF7882834.1 beta-ketoacyl-ACP synthase II [Candidatus Cloacimonadota bacterium]
MSKRRVVITGLGTLNAVGNSVDETWQSLLAGKSGIDTIKSFELTNDFASHIAGEVKDLNYEDYFDRKRRKKLDPYSQFALIASHEAMKDSGLDAADFNHDKAGVLIASGIGGMLTFEQEASKLVLKGPRRISPFFIPKMISNIASAEVAIEFNLRGINYNITSACASANHAIGTAFRTIQYGDADIILTGGAEASVTPLAVAGFCSMKALSTRNDEPQKACRPFDRDRDGFIMAEGSGVLVMEELEHALSRGAQIYAEVVGYGATCDAFHITAPADNGEGGARAMQNALDDAGIAPEKIEFISAHGTSTPLNDPNESLAIKTVFGNHAYKLKVNSTKSMVGHTLGAAAAIEAIVCCKTIQNGKIHPTINLENPDPVCDLDYVADGSIDYDVNFALSNSLGFGGHNAVMLFKKYN